MPWLGIRYVKAIEDYLQDVILENLSAYTQSIATNLETQADQIPNFPPGESYYASPLRTAPSLDGYDADWGDYSNPLIKLNDPSTNKTGASLKIGRHEDSLFIYLAVKDEARSLD